jgi:putative PIN family toxin of toxin-antitoxin system
VLRATPDTNILISGIVFRRGHPADLIRLGTTGQVNLTVSPAILGELADVLVRKFRATPDEIAEAREITMDAARVVIPKVELSVVKQDPDDDRILECAVSAGSQYIVTGDKDLLRLKTYDGIDIRKVADFLAQVNRGR